MHIAKYNLVNLYIISILTTNTKINMSLIQGTALVVDDEADICGLLTSFLKRRNYETSFAMTLQEGLKKCETDLPDIIFLDNNLPDGAGIDFISKFNSLSPRSRIIVISAMTQLKEKALNAGATGFVGKPISYSLLENYL